MAVYIALISWPVVVIILFRRTSLPTALIWSIIAGFLLLPPKVGVDLALLPKIDKTLIPSVSAALMAALVIRQRSAPGRQADTAGPQTTVLPGWLPRDTTVRILILMLVAGSFMTSWLNNDPLIYGGRFLRGLSSYDAFSITMNTLVGLLPLFLARKFLADPSNHRTLLLIFCIAGLLYSLLALYEVRMSPRLNSMLYGFFAHDWRQHMRSNGWRPIVFLNHGLVVGLFLSSSALATLGYFRSAQTDRRWLYIGAALWLAMTLVLAKNLGALLTLITLAPVLLLFGVRTQLFFAAAIAVMVLSFPILRSTGYAPVNQVVSLAQSIDPARAASFQFRLDNEDRLLNKAHQRPVFGWGGWGRARVYDNRGNDLSTLDGYWIITVGEGGWIRYIGEFGLLAIPIILLAFRRRRYEISLATSGVCLVLAGNLVDLIPNSGLTPITWLMVGALIGRLELQKIEAPVEPSQPTEAETAPASRYSRPRPDRVPQPAAVASERLTYSRQSHRSGKPTGAKI